MEKKFWLVSDSFAPLEPLIVKAHYKQWAIMTAAHELGFADGGVDKLREFLKSALVAAMTVEQLTELKITQGLELDQDDDRITEEMRILCDD